MTHSTDGRDHRGSSRRGTTPHAPRKCGRLAGKRGSLLRGIFVYRATSAVVAAVAALGMTLAAALVVAAGPVAHADSPTAAPSPPQSPTAVWDPSAQTALVTWAPPANAGSSPILEYGVTIVNTSGDAYRHNETVSVAAPATSVTLTGLQSGRIYGFYIVARSALGESGPYESRTSDIWVGTLPHVVDPPIVTTATDGSNAIWVTVQKKPLAIPSLTHYLIQVIDASGSVIASRKRSATSETTFYEQYFGLPRLVPLRVLVAGINSVGTAPNSPPSAEFTIGRGAPTAPGKPTVNLDGNIAHVHWTAPGDDGASPNTGYTLTVQPVEDVFGDPPGPPFTVTSPAGADYQQVALPRGVTYTLTVTAHNAFGSSPTSMSSDRIVVQREARNVRPPVVPTSPTVGRKITATSGTWDVSGGHISYEWFRDGQAVPMSNNANYWPDASDVGKRLTVAVTMTALGYDPVTAVSAPTYPVRRANIVNTSLPSVLTAVPRVGRLVRVSGGSWNVPATLRYQWRADGRTIPGATGRTYKPTRRDKGKRLSVAVTATKPGYTSVRKVTKATRPVR